jgi:hypothetical protein
VLELNDGPQLLVEVENQTVLQVVGGSHVLPLFLQSVDLDTSR